MTANMTGPRTWCLALALLLLGAGPGAARADVEDRINAAIPLSGPAQIALLEMRRLVGDPRLRGQIEAQLQVKIRLRALQCGQNFVIAPGSSEQQIRRQYGGDPCLAAQDAAIADWLGLRTVGGVLELPALRPMPAGAPRRIADLEAPIQRVYFAAQAAVAVVSSYKDIETVDLSSGLPINTRLAPRDELPQSISPNGRVYAVFHDGQQRFYDSEDGTLLASTQWCAYLGNCGFHWLDNRTALVVAAGNRGPELYDFLTGDFYPFDGQLEPIERIAPVAGASATYIAFRNTGLTEFRLDYAGGSPHADILQTEAVRLNLIPMTGGPVAGGRYYVNTSNGQLYVSDTGTLSTNTVDLGDFFVQRALPESDPDRLLIAGYLRGGPTTWRFYEYALREQTLSALDVAGLPSTQFTFDPAQHALYVLAGEVLTRVDTLPHGNAVPRAAFAASMQAAQSALPRPAPYRFAPPGTVRIITSGGVIRSIMAAGPPEAMAAPIPGPVARLAGRADVQGIGIFGAVAGRSLRPSVPGTVRVVIQPRQRPLVLVLSSFSSVQWHLRVAARARLSAVLITGPRGSSVEGQGNVPVVVIGGAYSYVAGSPSYAVLQNEVYAWTGKRMSLFQCGLRGKEFLIY
jgi:hypothetical protein